MQDPAAMFSQMNGNPQFPEQEHLKCPRCDSSNTKFCYYNNYNLSQPRHFCKNCRRYWTKGGVLRNIPVGGGSRKNSKRNSSSTTPAQAPAPAPAGSSSSSSPPHDAQPSEEPYRLMLINAAQPASLNHDRPILDLNGGNFSSLSTPHMGHFGNSTDGPNSDGSNFTDHGQTQSSTHDPGSWNEDPPEVYRPNCWSGSNVWPDNLAMYTPQSTSFQQFIEFPSRRTQDS